MPLLRSDGGPATSCVRRLRSVSRMFSLLLLCVVPRWMSGCGPADGCVGKWADRGHRVGPVGTRCYSRAQRHRIAVWLRRLRIRLFLPVWLRTVCPGWHGRAHLWLSGEWGTGTLRCTDESGQHTSVPIDAAVDHKATAWSHPAVCNCLLPVSSISWWHCPAGNAWHARL